MQRRELLRTLGGTAAAASIFQDIDPKEQEHDVSVPSTPNRWVWPLSGTSVPDAIGSPFGPRVNFGKYNFHEGIDLRAPEGTAVHAAAAGRIHRLTTYFISVPRSMAGLAMTLVLTMSACLPQATSPEPVSAISEQCRQASVKQPPVDLQAVVDEFVQSIPAADTAGYADPTRDPTGRTALVNGFTKVTEGNPVVACQALAPVNYRVTLTTDRTTGRDVVLLREQQGQDRYARAWGLYLISWPPGANPSTLVVEAPHACPNTATTGESRGCGGGDRFTHLVAVKVFQEATARYLFINGADRRANGKFEPTDCEQDSRCADMAHQPESPFEKIHEKAVASLGSRAKVYQSHRFLSSDHDPEDNVLPGTSGPANVVVSAGITNPSRLTEDVAHGIEAAAPSFFHVCLFNDSQDSQKCSQLGATTNVQKDHLSGGRFVHVEASDQVVREPCGAPCRRDQLATAITAVMK